MALIGLFDRGLPQTFSLLKKKKKFYAEHNKMRSAYVVV